MYIKHPSSVLELKQSSSFSLFHQLYSLAFRLNSFPLHFVLVKKQRGSKRVRKQNEKKDKKGIFFWVERELKILKWGQ